MPEFVHYQVRQKNRLWGQAITEGFRARVSNPGETRLGRGYVHIITGLQFGALETLKAVRRSGEPYIFIDRAYFGGGHKSGRMRMTFGAYQQNWLASKPVAREWGVTLEPWRDGGEFIMAVPPSPQVEDLFDFRWERDFMPRIKAACAGVELRVVVSLKSDRDASPLAERLKGCAAVVTWSSNVAVEAICAGVPAWTSPHAAAAPVAGDLARFDPRASLQPVHRDAWFRSLCWAQFTVDEVRNGFARDVVMEGACAAA